MLALALLLQLPPVLMYHQVDTVAPPTAIGRALTVTPKQFSSELDYLRRRHLRAVGIDDYVAAVRAGKPTRDMVILTFDDAYVDQYTQALPILRAHHAHATFFVTTGNVGRINHLTWRDIREMVRDRMSIGGHSVQHIDLANLPPAQQRFEIDDCLRELRRYANVVPISYAYPSGSFDRTTETVLATTPIAFGFTTDPRFELGAAPQFEIPRIRVMRGMSTAAFAAALARPEPALRVSLAPLPPRKAALQPRERRRRLSPGDSGPR